MLNDRSALDSMMTRYPAERGVLAATDPIPDFELGQAIRIDVEFFAVVTDSVVETSLPRTEIFPGHDYCNNEAGNEDSQVHSTS